MDWDAENFEPPPSTISNQWDGEDEDETVKDNWEDDDEDKKKDEPKKASAQSKKPKSRLEEKIEERERREMERQMRMQNIDLSDIDTSKMTPEEIEAEKKRRQIASDLENAKEILGVKDEDMFVDDLNPKNKETFIKFKDALCKRILMYKTSDHFSFFIEELFRDLSAGLSSTELKKLKMNMDNMFNEKVRVEKLEKSKKTKGKGKAKLRVEGNDMIYDEYSAYTVDDYDDFM